jgi:hypothetical protein
MGSLSAFDSEDTRETCECSLLRLFDAEDRQNKQLVECLLRSHTSTEILSFEQLGACTFRETLAKAKQLCAHPALSRISYQHDGGVLSMAHLSQQHYGAVFESILAFAENTEATSSKEYMHCVEHLKLGSALRKICTLEVCGIYGDASWPVTLFTRIHRSVVSRFV